MAKLFLIVGNSGSGKDTLISEIIKKYPDKICTTKSKRNGKLP